MSGSRPGSDLSEHSFYAGDEPQTRRASIASIDSAAQSEASASYKPTLLARALNTFPLNLLSDVSRLTMAGGVGLIALGLTALVPGGQIAILGAIAVLATAAVARKAYLNYQEVKKHGFLSVTQRVENEIQPGTHGRKDDPSFWDGIKACFGLYPAALVDTGVGLSIGAGFVKAGALVTTTVSAGGGAAFVVLNALNTFMTGKKALQAGDEVDGLKKMQAALTGQNASVSDLQKAFYEAFNNKSSEIEAQCDKTKPQEVQKTLEAQKTLIVLRTASLEALETAATKLKIDRKQVLTPAQQGALMDEAIKIAEKSRGSRWFKFGLHASAIALVAAGFVFPPIAAAAALKGAFVGLVTKIGLLGSFAAFAANFAYYGIGKIGEFKLGVKGLVRAMLGLKSGEQVLEATKSKDVAPAPSRESSQGSAVDAGKHRASHVVLVATDAKQAEGSVAEVKDARKPGCRGRFAGSFYRGSAPVAPAPAPALTPTAEPSAENKEQGGNRSRSSSAGVLHGNPAANAHDSAQMQTVRDENDLDIV